MDKRKTIAGVVAIAILAFGAWFFFWREVKDPQVAALEQQRDADFARQAQMSEPERRSSREEFGKKMQGLSPEQRQKFMESSMPIMLKMFEAQIDRFEAMSPDEQRKEMDKRIDEMKARGKMVLVGAVEVREATALVPPVSKSISGGRRCSIGPLLNSEPNSTPRFKSSTSGSKSVA